MFTATSVTRKISIIDYHRSHRPRTPRKLSNALQSVHEVHKDATAGVSPAIQDFLLQQQQEHQQFINSFNNQSLEQYSQTISKQLTLDQQSEEEDEEETDEEDRYEQPFSL